MAANVLTLNQVVQDGGKVTLYAVLTDDTGAVSTIVPTDITTVQVEAGKDMPLSPESYQLFAQTGEGIAYTVLVDMNRSITKAELDQMKAALKGLILSMAPQDRMKLVSMDSGYIVLVDYTDDRNILTRAVDGLKRGTVSKVNIFSAIAQSLDALRTTPLGFPKRCCLIIYTYGVDSSTYTLAEIDDRVTAARLPIYIVGLKGPAKVNDKTVTAAQHNTRLSSMGQLARNSNGRLLMTTGMTVAEATDLILNYLRGTLVYTVTPPYAKFGQESISWRLMLNEGGVLTQSNELLVGLSLTGVPTPIPVSTPTSSPSSAPTPTSTLTPVSVPEPFFGSLEGGVPPITLLIAGGGVIALLCGLIIFFIKKQRKINHGQMTGEKGFPAYEAVYDTMGMGEGIQAPLSIDDGEGTIGLLSFGEETMAIPAMQQKMLTVSFTEEYNGRSRMMERAIIKNLIIGRDKECDIILEDRSVSRKHCKLSMDGVGLFLEDMGSRSGSFVNDQPAISRVALHSGDTIRLGMTILRVTIKH